ncbi:hypothetical protein V1477_000920 [Vespula maculifrons]|uniref:Uncharacterized protein n=2 Tax=Vespula TaxID=7451 RepID=A0A834JEM0_VESVU|nr:hypothetical protein HZH66_012476 [Vespula vulgaris]
MEHRIFLQVIKPNVGAIITVGYNFRTYKRADSFQKSRQTQPFALKSPERTNVDYALAKEIRTWWRPGST